MKNEELEASSFSLVTGGDEDLCNEWDWIIEHVNSNPYWQIVNAIEKNYAGRGPLFEVPKREVINRGIRELLKAGILIVVDEKKTK